MAMKDDDTIIEIGATVDLSNVVPKLDEMVSATQDAAAKMTESFSSINKAAAEANESASNTEKISASQQEAAETANVASEMENRLAAAYKIAAMAAHEAAQERNKKIAEMRTEDEAYTSSAESMRTSALSLAAELKRVGLTADQAAVQMKKLNVDGAEAAKALRMLYGETAQAVAAGADTAVAAHNREISVIEKLRVQYQALAEDAKLLQKTPLISAEEAEGLKVDLELMAQIRAEAAAMGATINDGAMTGAHGISRLDGAMAYGAVRAGAFAAQLGPLGFVLGGIGRASESLAPLLSALFIPSMIMVGVDLINQWITKFEQAEQKLDEVKIKLMNMSMGMTELAQSTELENLKLQDQIDKLNGVPTPNGLDESIIQTTIDAERLLSKMADLGLETNKALEEVEPGVIHAFVSELYRAIPAEAMFLGGMSVDKAEAWRTATARQHAGIENIKNVLMEASLGAQEMAQSLGTSGLKGEAAAKAQEAALRRLGATFSGLSAQVSQLSSEYGLNEKQTFAVRQAVLAYEQASKVAIETAVTAEEKIKLAQAERNKTLHHGDASRVEVWKENLERMKANATTFYAVTLQDEVNYWQKILALEKLTGKERVAIEMEINRARHALALETYRNLIALDEELIAATREGSAERMDAVRKERDDVIAAWGEKGSQAIAANKKVLDEQMKGDLLTAQSVAQSVQNQNAAYESGSAQRVAIAAQAIEKLKQMQQNLNSGKTATGAPEPSQPIGPTADTDSRLRILMRKHEVEEIQKIIDAMTAHLVTDYREEADKAIREALRVERERVESIASTGRAFDENKRIAEGSTEGVIAAAHREAEELIATSNRSASTQISELNRLHSLGLLSAKQRRQEIELVIEAQERATTQEIRERIESIKSEELSTLAIIQEEALKQEAILGTAAAQKLANDATVHAKEAADAKIIALEKRLAQVYLESSRQRKQLADDAANAQIQKANQVAAVISSSFTKSLSEMQTSEGRYMSFMQTFWLNLERGFAQTFNHIIESWIKTLTQKLVLYALHQTKIFTLETQGTVQHAVQEQAKVAATAAAQAEETAVTAAGENSRKDVGIVGMIKEIGAYAAHAAAKVFDWVITAVPFPANVVLAPIMAAATFTGVAAYKTLASAAGGMDVDQDQLVKVHSKEMILPSNLTSGLKNIISAGAFSTPAAMTAPAASHQAAAPAPARASTSIHHHHNEFNLYHNGADAKEVLQNELVPMIKLAMRNGELNS